MSGRILAGFLAVLLMMVASAAEPSRVVQAEEILKKIELGQPVEYDNVIVEGELDLRGLNLTRMPVERVWYEEFLLGLPNYYVIVSSPITIRNSIIKSSVSLNGCVFQNEVKFLGTIFYKPALLGDSRFNQTVVLKWAQFNQTADFGDAWFNQTADFGDAWFNQTADFSGAHFNQDASFFGFYGAYFNQTADFNRAQFNQTADFHSAHFNETADFNRAQFNQTAEFASAKFNQTADFNSAQFNHIADFRDAWFNQTVDFSGAHFNQYTDFSGGHFNQTAHFWTHFNQTADFHSAHFNERANFLDAEFNQTADFRDARFNQTADFRLALFNQESGFVDARFLNLSFDYCQFSKEAFFDGAQIKGTLSLYRTKYDTLNIRWSSIHDLAYDDTAYHLLIQNFNKLGFGDDASECQYSYRCKHREELWRQHRFDLWFFDLLAYATYGYGLRPVRPLGWSLSLILIGGLFFFLTGSVARSKEGPSGKMLRALRRREDKPADAVSIWESLLLSATFFTSGASSIISATPTEFVPVGRGRYVVVLLRLLGWILFVLFLSSLNRTI